ncbi:MAG: S1C family serine protease [Haliscomenobacter sp.]
MKQWLNLVLAGMFGGLVTFGGIRLLEKGSTDRAQVSSLARQVKLVNANAAAIPTFDFSAAAERATPAVVHIKSEMSAKTGSQGSPFSSPFEEFFGRNFGGRGIPQQSSGSGVIYSSDGYILTNNHVVESATHLEVTLSDNRKFKAKVVGTDPKTDLAVLKIEGDKLTPMEIGNSDEAKVGEWALAVGNPFDLTSTVTAGIISAKGRNIQLLGGGTAIESFIQTDAAVNPGNSGGALVDAAGKLIGINTAIATRTGAFSGYSFAIPINLAKRIADDIIEFGSYQRPFLGISISDLDSEYANELGVDLSQGVVVEELSDGGSAQYAGILPKDVITEVDSRSVKSVAELQEVVGRAKVGDTIDVTLYRKGKRIQVPVRLRKNSSTE